jgi:hypothetical protein
MADYTDAPVASGIAKRPRPGGSYNNRLFSRGIRSRFHLLRFHWAIAQLKQLQRQDPECFPLRCIELGCYDAKTVRFIEDAQLPMEAYDGFDADWEDGLSLGQALWKGRDEVRLRFCIKPDDISSPERPYNCGLSMETFEHIPPELVEPYLERLSQVIDGYLIITVPVERGVTFFYRHAIKRALGLDRYKFTAAEFMNSMVGRLDRVTRDNHKGFDDRLLVRQVGRYFDVVKVEGIGPGLPVISWNFQCGMVARSRPS